MSSRISLILCALAVLSLAAVEAAPLYAEVIAI